MLNKQETNTLELLTGTKYQPSINLLAEADHLAKELKFNEAISKSEKALREAISISKDDLSEDIAPYYIKYADKLLCGLTSSNNPFTALVITEFHKISEDVHKQIQKEAKDAKYDDDEKSKEKDSKENESSENSIKEDENEENAEEDAENDKDQEKDDSSEDNSEDNNQKEDSDNYDIEEKERILINAHPADEQIIWENLEVARIIIDRAIQTHQNDTNKLQQLSQLLSDTQLKTAELLSVTGSIDEAIKELLKCIDIRNKHGSIQAQAEAYYVLGTIYLTEIGKEDESISTLNTCRKLVARYSNNTASKDDTLLLAEVESKIQEAEEQKHDREEIIKEMKSITTNKVEDEPVATEEAPKVKNARKRKM